MWYLQSIEDKNYVAIFYTSGREDGIGTNSSYASFDTTNKLQKLDSIALFSKPELKKYGTHTRPIKTAVFVYSYSLCEGVFNQAHYSSTPNGNSGKLTLDKVYFTYQGNTRGILNAYSFKYKGQYGTGGYVPGYSPVNIDRWGNLSDLSLIASGTYYEHVLNSRYFPYTIQDASVQNTMAGVWNLNEIDLPSGGKIKVDFAPNEYGYVQNRRATQMCFIKGFADHDGISSHQIVGQLYDNALFHHEYMVVQLPESVSCPTILKRKYLDNIGSKLYFNCLVKVAKAADNKDTASKYEFIKGYTGFGTDTTTLHPDLRLDPADHSIAYIHLTKADDDAHTHMQPVLLAALQTLRLELPDVAYKGNNNFDANTHGWLQVSHALIGELQNISDLILGFNDTRVSEHYCQNVQCNGQSWVRLACPEYQKYGGGSRVSQIRMYDSWHQFTGDEPGFTSGQNYSYQLENGQTSGVATWEPAFGGEENSNRIPAFYQDKMTLAPNNMYYVEEPYGEMLFPSPTVGYRRVVVSSYQDGDIRSKTGHTVSEFYTSYDFPVYAQHSKPSFRAFSAKGALLFLKNKTLEGLTASQGYSVTLNDMHGKPKATYLYDADNILLSSTKYFYKTTAMNVNGDPQATTDNRVTVMDQTGAISQATLGVDFELYNDSRSSHTETLGLGISSNFDMPQIGPFPIPLFLPFNSFDIDIRSFHSISIMKVIRKHGVLDHVVAMENGSTIETHNLVYDSETGKVIMTSTQNEWGRQANSGDKVYSINYPAWWAYPNMGQAYKYDGLVLNNRLSLISIVSGISSFTPFNSLLNPGDELIATGVGPEQYIYIIADPSSGANLAIDKDGNLITADFATMKVVRPAARNILGPNLEEKESLSPFSLNSFARVTRSCDSLINVLTSFNEDDGFTCAAGDTVLKDVIYTYRDFWPMQNICDQLTPDGGGNFTGNPYRYNLLNIWRPFTTYAFLANREIADPTIAPDDRRDGEFILQNYWAPGWNGGPLIPNLYTKGKYQMVNTVTLYDEFSNQLENKNSLGIYSAALFGYNQKLATAIAQNARYEEVGNNNFEDKDSYYGPSGNTCRSNHWLFAEIPGDGIVRDSSRAHTGLWCLKIPSGKEDSIISSTTSNADMTPSFLSVASSLFHIDASSVIGNFAPQPDGSSNKKYLISAWVHQGATCTTPNYSAGQIRVKVRTGSTVVLSPSGPIIDGWQRIEGTFDVTPSATQVMITLKASGSDVYFDDIRVFPFLGNMKAFVYNPYNFRLMATLDENNYATFYEYDDAGNMVRVNRETEKGIITIKEGRAFLKQ